MATTQGPWIESLINSNTKLLLLNRFQGLPGNTNATLKRENHFEEKKGKELLLGEGMNNQRNGCFDIFGAVA